MKYRKFQTTIQPDGKVSTMPLGTVDATNFDADKAFERDRYSRVARSGAAGRINTIEVYDTNLITVYVNGRVTIIHWVPETEPITDGGHTRRI